MRSNLDCALTYASLGLAVFPCNRMTKEPITQNGFYSATCDPSEIRRMWLGGQDYNVAIRIPENYCILDIDNLEITKEYGEIPETVTARTARIGGGFHLWYKMPDGVKFKRKINLVTGIDLLTDLGYVVAPNSIHPNGNIYKWVKPPVSWRDVPVLPDWVVKLAIAKEAEIKAHSGEQYSAKVDITSILDGVEEGNRQQSLFLLASSLRGRGVLIDEAKVILREAALRAKPPYTEQSTDAMVERVYAKYLPNPKEAPSRRIWKVSDLIKEDFEEVQYFVEKLLIPGAVLFSSDPKLGKSMILANIFKSIATGKKALGKYYTKQSGALYLDLEQGEELGSKRWIQILHGEDVGLWLDTCFTWDRMDQGGYEELDTYLKFNPHVRVVAIDTLARFWPTKDLVSGTAYQKDYAVMAKIADLARKYKAAIICVHHNTKNKSEGDFIKNASGSMGLTAASDIIWGLDRARLSDVATMKVTGKNIQEHEFRLTSYNNNFNWYAV